MGTQQALRRCNEAVAVVLAVAAAIWLLTAPEGGFDVAFVPLALLLWAWLFGVVLLVQWVLLRPWGRPVPLPLGGRTLSPLGAVAIALGVLGVLVLREGLLPEPMRLEALSWYGGAKRAEAEARHGLQWDGQQPGAQPPRLAGSFLQCEVACEPQGTVCRGVRRWLQCDGDTGPPSAEQPVTSAHIRIEGAADPFCYVPLYKSARIEPTVEVSLRSDAAPAVEHRLQLDARIERRLTGLASCHLLRKRLGHDTASLVAERMQALIARR